MKPKDGAIPGINRRSLKIEAVGDFARRQVKPRIRLSGHWLERAGFMPGHRVDIHLHKPGELTLQFKEELPLHPLNQPPAEDHG